MPIIRCLLFSLWVLFLSSVLGGRNDHAPIPHIEERTYKGEIRLTDFITDEALVLNPATAKSASPDAVYVLDYGGPSIKKFTSSGILAETFGNGRGSGPGEFDNPTDFDVAPDGDVYVSDPVNGRVSHFAPNGTHLGDYRTEHRPHRIAAFERGFVIMALSAEHMFEAYDGDERTTTYDTPSEYSLRESSAFDGFIAGTTQRGVVYAGLWYGRLIAFGRSGTIRFNRPSRNESSPPNIIRTRSGDTVTERVDRENASISALSVCIDEGYTYVLSRDFERDGVAVLDRYHLESGDYEASFRLEYEDARLRDVAVSKNRLYAAAYNGVIVAGEIPGE